MLAFLGGALQPGARATVEQHIAACGACADLVTWAAADQANSTTRLPGHEGRPFVGGLHPGVRVARYQILGAVGRGGMGEVYAAYHPDLDRRIALKVVHGLGADTSERRARLLREARAIARLSHPNVVTVHDAGSFGDRVFIAMEYVDGLTVDDWLRAAPRTWQQIVDVFMAAGRGLAAAHAAGVIHRDFKPQNVMIGRDGAVRVMDFGLARLTRDDVADNEMFSNKESSRVVPIDTVTNTGALIGTPAYMSPEQLRREKSDARSDQYSFCVALHEALYGARPPTTAGTDGAAFEPSRTHHPPGGVPNWLRAIVRRGASPDSEERYPTMDTLLAALARGRTRVRRGVSAFAAGSAFLLLTAGGWRFARGDRFVCDAPKERIAAVWPVADTVATRRLAIQRAFAASGRATAQTSWERLSKVLDEHVTAWSAMYVQACEATHLYREQSPEVLDLRMSCLRDNLDQVRALTDALATADAGAVSHAVGAAKDLPSVGRCADVALLKSAVPLPHDERTFGEVLRLRREIAKIEALREIGRLPEALHAACALRAEVKASGYIPLLGELLAIIGTIQTDSHAPDAGATLEEAMFTAESAGDDATAARAAAVLIYTTGIDLGRVEDSRRWFRLTNAILDRLGKGHSRMRAWALNNLAAVLATTGDLDETRTLYERAIALKEESLGPEHPDLAVSLAALGSTFVDLGQPDSGLPFLERAISIHVEHTDPGNPLLANAFVAKAEALHAMGRNRDALPNAERAAEMLQGEGEFGRPYLAGALAVLGDIMLAQGRAATAIRPLERAVEIYENYKGAGTLLADTQFALARGLWDGGGDRHRALTLASSARDVYARANRRDRLQAAQRWLNGRSRHRNQSTEAQ